MADDQQVDGTEKEARNLGWLPKEEFRGSEEQWVDAATFVEKGRHILPIMKQNNERLTGQVGALTARMESLANSLKAAQATIEALEESHDADVQEQVKQARENLKTELAAASRDGDHEAVASLTDKLTQLGTAQDAAEDKDDKAGAPPKPQVHPEVVAWYAKNADFMGNARKVALAQAIGAELRAAGDTSLGAAFLDRVAEEVDKTLGVSRAAGYSKVGAGNGGGGRSGGGNNGSGKTYSDLPAEAKQACEKMAGRLVGANRAHKDLDSWRKSYAAQFFKE